MVAQQPVKRPAAAARWFWTACVALWLVFAAVLLIDSSQLINLWHQARDLPLVGEILAWVLFLPWMVGLWIWHQGWDSWLRVALIVVVAVGGAVIFFPRSRKA